jgi:molybdate transport system substrate-binding protein
MKRGALRNLVLILFLIACSPQVVAHTSNAPDEANPSTVTVFAAASLTEAFEEIGRTFEAKNPGVEVFFNFGGSQQLAQQINEGAPVDVFASANNQQMEAVISAGNILTGTRQTFAKNRLVVVFPEDNPAELHRLEDLAKPGLKLVFAALEVPVGQYSLEFLDRAVQDPAFGLNFKDAVLNNVVSYEENVKAVLSKVALGEADAGIVYNSDISTESAGSVGRLKIPDHLNILAEYPVAVTRESKDPEQAAAFIALVLSTEGQNILAKYGFIPILE